MFMSGEKCELWPLEGNDQEALLYSRSINRGWTTQFLFTGSIPMVPVDVKAVWKKEKDSGSIEFGIWCPVRGAETPSAFVGTCGLYSKRDIYRSWEFRIIIFDPGWIEKGVGSEATRLVVNYAFKRLNAHRVWLGVNSENIRAVKCYEKVGFKHEGELRDELFVHGKYTSAIRMGILESEWTSIAQ